MTPGTEGRGAGTGGLRVQKEGGRWAARRRGRAQGWMEAAPHCPEGSPGLHPSPTLEEISKDCALSYKSLLAVILINLFRLHFTLQIILKLSS